MTTATAPELLHDLLDERSAASAELPALRAHGLTWTYRELHRRSTTLAHWLSAQGVERTDRVLVIADNHPDVVALLYAASRIGAAFVIVNSQIRAFHLKHILEDCGPALVLAAGEPAQQALAAGGDTPVRLLSELPPTGTAPVRVGGADRDRADEPAALIYTSGSTAMPKAVVSPHRQMLFAARAIHDRLGYRSGDVVFCCLPLSFDYGLYQVFLSCLAGACLVLGDAADAGAALLGRLREERATVFPLVPSLATTLVRLAQRSGTVPERLRLVTNTGAALSVTTSQRLRELMPELDVVPMFGLTECKRVSIEEPNADRTRPNSVGLPLPGTEVFVVDPQGHRLPPGEVGELVVRGPHVMAGYWRAEELTARRFRTDENGQAVLHTGDRCRLDEQGRLYFAGRDDDIYKQRGFRVSSIEVEAAALDVLGVELAAVLTPDDDSPARLVVTGDISRQALAKELATRIEDAKLPAEYHVVAGLPLSVNGKIDKAALRRELHDR